ncbi:Flp family type IVb pilin [Erythrobacteraceae bacterium CFH 75059]|uniref:Flp family type IVb pilin n=1 Tax=Qipengyuania thermophila TaxID=2509361 RepID=UPI00101F13EE|nr:Flp family type IVb pilin [Qipengyuania thermophila]TCD05229.1 Flp family type IVb pilin [Erythrobacteraceae bacterium CFH 75059]
MTTINKLIRDEDGATAIEYGLIAALIAVGLIAALSSLGGSLSRTFTGVGNQLNTANA